MLGCPVASPKRNRVRIVHPDAVSVVLPGWMVSQNAYLRRIAGTNPPSRGHVVYRSLEGNLVRLVGDYVAGQFTAKKG